jgi:hypothetical protein
LAKPIDIAVLHMAPIGAQMSDDPVSAGAFAHSRRRHRIGLGIFGIGHAGVTHLPQRGDVIDINSQPKSAHWLPMSTKLF